MIKAESGFDEDAQSHAGAHGLMQLTQETFDWIASLYPPEEGTGDIYDPAANLHCGCALLRLLLDQYGSLEVAHALSQSRHGQRGRLAAERGVLPRRGDAAHHPLPGDGGLCGPGEEGPGRVPQALRAGGRSIVDFSPPAWYSMAGRI